VLQVDVLVEWLQTVEPLVPVEALLLAVCGEAWSSVSRSARRPPTQLPKGSTKEMVEGFSWDSANCLRRYYGEQELERKHNIGAALESSAKGKLEHF